MAQAATPGLGVASSLSRRWSSGDCDSRTACSLPISAKCQALDSQPVRHATSWPLHAQPHAAAIRRVKGVLDELMTEKGFPSVTIDHVVTPVAGGPKLVNVTFTVDKGPKLRIRRVEFVGNSAISDGTLQRKLKENKPKGILSWITGGGTFKETAFEEDAARVVDYYQREGYAKARVGQPDLRVLEDSKAIVSTASSAVSALEVLGREAFDVIVSDIAMPNGDGYELISEVRTRGIDTPALAVTALARAEDRRKAMSSGYQAHVAKPVETEELLGTVASLIAR